MNRNQSPKKAGESGKQGFPPAMGVGAMASSSTGPDDRFRGGAAMVAARPMPMAFGMQAPPVLGGSAPVSRMGFGAPSRMGKDMGTQGQVPGIFGGFGKNAPQMGMSKPTAQTRTAVKQSYALEVTAPMFDEAVMSPYNNLKSAKSPKECAEKISALLEHFAEMGDVDYEMKDFQASGRIYANNDMSEFQVNLYQSSDNQCQTVIEIRRTTGDSFVHDEIWSRLQNELQNSGYVVKQVEAEAGEEFPMLGWGALGDLPPLTDMDLDMTMLQDDASQASSAQELAREWFNTVTDRDSFREVYRSSAGALAKEVEGKSEDVVEFLATQKDTLDRMVAPLMQDLHDTLIIKSVLTVVNHLLRLKDQRIQAPNDLSARIEQLRDQWNSGIEKNVGPVKMRFIRSQQVVRMCQQCIEALA